MKYFYPSVRKYSALIGALAFLICCTTSANAGVIYNQLAGQNGQAQTSQEFEAALTTNNSEQADDWTATSDVVLRSLFVPGFTSAAGVNPTNFDVTIYADSSGWPSDTIVSQQTDITPVNSFPGIFANDIQTTLNICPVALDSGKTYWFSVVVDMDFNGGTPPDGQWFWGIVSAQSFSLATFRNPGNAFGTGCTSWGRRAICLTTPGFDNAFSLLDSFAGCVSVYPYLEDFEGCGSFWTAGGTSSTWALGAPSYNTQTTASSGTNAWVTNLTGASNNGEDSWVQSPCFDFTNLSNPQISIDINRDLLLASDGAVLQYSTDDGATWTNAGDFLSGYYDTNVPLVGGGAGGQNAEHWQVVGENAWTTKTVVMSSLTGQSNVIFRVAFKDNSSTTEGGMAFDNFAVSAGPFIDVSPTALIGPANGCDYGFPDSVKIEVTNFGNQDTTNLIVSYTITGPSGVVLSVTDPGLQSTPVFTGDSVPNIYFNQTFPTVTIPDSGTYNFTIIVSHPNDNDPSNDTLIVDIIKLYTPAAPGIGNKDTICGDDTACISALGSGLGRLIWYDDSLGTTVVGTGDTIYVTPDTTTNYWVSENTSIFNNIQTTMANNNGSSGNSFSVINLTPFDMTIDSFYINVSVSGAGNVYSRPGYYLNANNLPGWVFEGTATTVGAGVGNNTLLNVGGIVIPAGDTVSLFVGHPGIQYTNGNGANQLYDNGELRLELGHGHGVTAPPTTSQFNPRVWNGTIFYSQQGCESAKTAICVGFVVPDSISVPNDTIVCDSVGSTTFSVLATSPNDPNYIYNWSGDSKAGFLTGSGTATATLTPIGTTIFGVTGFDPATGCRTSAQTSISFLGINVDSVVANKDTICENDTAKITPSFSIGGETAILINESFDALNGNLDPGVVPSGWNRNRTTDPNWRPEDDTHGSFGTGPTGGHAGAGVQAPSNTNTYMFMETSGGIVGDTATLEAPSVDLTSMASADLSFWYYMYGANIDRIAVDVSLTGTGGWTNLLTISGQQQTANNQLWQQANINLNAWTGNIIYLRWYGINVACCSGDVSIDDVFLDAIPNANFAWTPNMNIADSTEFIACVYPSATTTYTFTVDNGFCVDSGSVTINTISPAPAPVANDTSICGVGTVPLEATGTGGMLTWYDANGDSIGTGSPLTSPVIGGQDTFYVAEWNGRCYGPQDMLVVTGIVAPTISASIDVDTVCYHPDSTVNVTVNITVTSSNAGYSYSWAESDSGGLIVFSGAGVTGNPTRSSSYYVTASDAGTGCVQTDSVSIFIQESPLFSITLDQDTLCLGDTVLLCADTLPNSNEFRIESTQTIDFGVANSPSDISIFVDNLAPGTSASDLLSAEVNIDHDWTGLTEISLLAPDGSTVMLADNRGGSGDDFTNTVFLPNTAGAPAIATGAAPFTGSWTPDGTGGFSSFTGPAEGIWTFRAVSTSPTGFGNWINGILNFAQGSPNVFAWTPTDSLADPSNPKTLAWPATTTTYTASYTVNGCESTRDTTITVIPVPAPPVANDTTICGDHSIDLRATGANTLIWYDENCDSIFTGSGSQLWYTTPVITDTARYFVSGDDFCATGKDTLDIIHLQADTVIVTGPLQVCEGDTVKYYASSANAGYNYSWRTVPPGVGTFFNGNASGDTICAILTSSATVIATGSDGICSDVTGIDVEFNEIPLVTATVSDDTICPGDSAILTASVSNENATVSFTNNTTTGIPDNQPNNPALLPITVTGASANATDIIEVSLNIDHTWDADLDISLIAPDGSSIILSDDNGGTGDDYTGTNFRASSTNQITNKTAPFTGNFAPEEPFTNLTGPANGTWFLSVADDDMAGQFGFVLNWTITTKAASNVTWSPGVSLSDSTAMDPFAFPTSTTNYLVTANSGGCLGYDSVTLNVFPVAPQPTALDFLKCGTGTDSLIASGTGGQLIWYDANCDSIGTGDTIISPVIGSVDTFFVNEVLGECIGDKDTLIVSFTPSDTVDITASDTFICGVGDTVTLTAVNISSPMTKTYTYSWTSSPNGGLVTSMGNPVQAVPTGTGTAIYTVQGQDGICTGSDVIAIEVRDVAIVDVSTEDDTLCTGDTVQLNGFVNDPVVGSSTLLFSDDFSGQTGNGFANPIAPWSNQNTTAPEWVSQTATGTNANSTNTGPWYDNTSFGLTGGRYLFLETSGGTNGATDTVFLTTPIDLSTYVGGELSYFYHMYGINQRKLVSIVSIDGGNSWIKLKAHNGQQQTAGNDPWIQHVINLAPYVGNVAEFAWVGWNDATTADVALDDVSITGFNAGSTPTWTPNVNLSSDTILNPLAWPTALPGQEYFLTYTTSEGCTTVDSLFINVIPTPPKPIGEDTTKCGVGNMTFFSTNPGGGGTTKWYTSSGTAMGFSVPSATPFASGDTVLSPVITGQDTFFLAVDSAGCLGPYDTLVVSYVTPDSIVASASKLALCYVGDDSVTLTVINNQGNFTYEYTWTGSGTVFNATGDTVKAQPDSLTDFIVMGFDSAAGCTAFDTVQVAVLDSGSVTVTALRDTICPGDTVKLLAVKMDNYPPDTVLFEDFSGVLDADPGTAPNGWNRNRTTDPNWRGENDFNTNSGSTGPNGGHIGGGAHSTGTNGNMYYFMETSGGSSADTGTIETPAIDLSLYDQSANLSFWYHMYGATMGRMGVDVSLTGTGAWTNEWLQIGQVQTTAADLWIEQTVDLSAYAGQVIYLRWWGQKTTSFTSDMSIDDITVTGTSSQASWSWSPNATLDQDTTNCVNAFPTTTTGYTATYTNLYGCAWSGRDTVTVVPTPLAPIANDTTICANVQLPITATDVSGNNYHIWYNIDCDSIGTSSGTGTYFTTPNIINANDTFLVADFNGYCAGPKDTLVITHLTPPTATFTIVDSVVCDTPTSVTLTATSSNVLYNYTWTGSGTALNITGNPVMDTPTQTTTYYMKANDGTCTYRDTGTVIVEYGIDIVFDYTQDTVCDGDSVIMCINFAGDDTLYIEDFFGVTQFGNGSHINSETDLWSPDGAGSIPQWETEQANSAGTNANSTNTGPVWDHTNFAKGLGNPNTGYIMLETSGGVQGDFDDVIIRPVLTKNAPAVLSFWYHMYGAGMGDLNVYVSNSGNGPWGAPVWSASGQQHTSGSDPWSQAVVDLSPYIGPFQYAAVKFEGIRGTALTSDMALDDIMITSTPGYSIAWTPAATLSNDSTNKVTAIPVDTVTYTASVTSGNGCVNDTSLFVTHLDCDCFWTGAISNNWNDPGNWSCDLVPNNCRIDVTIPAGATPYPVVLAGTFDVHDVLIQATASITINGGAQLNVCGEWDNQGIAAHGIGTVQFVDSWDGGVEAFYRGNSVFENVILNRAGTGSVIQLAGSSVEISETGCVTLLQGDWITNGNPFTLKSETKDNAGTISWSVTDLGEIIGNVSMERYIPGTFLAPAIPGISDTGFYETGYHYLSAPFDNVQITDFGDNWFWGTALTNGGGGYPAFFLKDYVDGIATAFGTFYQYFEGAATPPGGFNLSTGSGGYGSPYYYERWIAPISALADRGIGYAAHLRDTITIDVTGTYNHGSSPSRFPTASGSGFDGWNLLGNPFPSYYDWTSAVRTNVDAAIYWWDPANLQYVSSVGGGSGVSPLINNLGAVDGAAAPNGNIIHPMQGFMVVAQAGGGTVTFDPVGRSCTSAGAFYKAGQGDVALVRLNMTGTNGLEDQILVYTDGNATVNYDGEYDAIKIKSPNRYVPTFSMVENDRALSINAIPLSTSDVIIPLGVGSKITDSYEIDLVEMDNLDATTMVYLEDRDKGIFHNMRDGAYNFTRDKADDEEGRFFLHFTAPLDLTFVGESCNGGDAVLTLSQNGIVVWDTYNVFDSEGNIIMSGNNMNGVYNINNLTAGTYTIEVTLGGYTATKDVEVTGDAPIIAEFTSTSSNVEVGEIINFTNATVNATDFEWNFDDGTVVSGIANPFYAFTTPGTYVVTLTATNAAGCQDIYTQVIEVTAKTTGVNPIAAGGVIDIYSDNDKIYVDFSDMKSVDATVKVYNLLGQEIASVDHNAADLLSIDVVQTDGNYYLVVVDSNDAIITEKVFVSNDQ